MMTTLKRYWRWLPLLPLAAAATLLAACSWYVDVWVANPCDSALRVEVYGGAPGQIGPYVAWRSETVPPNTLHKVDDAFVNKLRGSIRIVGYPEVIPVTEEMWPDDTVQLPAEACGSVWRR